MLNIVTDEINGDSCLISYYPNCFNKDFVTRVKSYLDKQNDFLGGYSGWGKEIPRLQKWYQMDGYDFSHNWKSNFDRWKAFPYDKNLLEIQSSINYKTNFLIDKDKPVNFNSCLVNCYRDGNDSIKPHFDSTENFGPTPVIAILSIGETRDIYFKRRRYNKDNPKSLKLDTQFQHLNCKISLEEGSLLIMAGDTQKYYVHEIPKENRFCSKRYSLTFREFLIDENLNNSIFSY